MRVPRRRFLQLTAGAFALPAISGRAQAQAYPSKPVRFVVGFAPGGPNDILARLIGGWLTERLGQPFEVENRAGGSSNPATELVVRAPADGYTTLLMGPANAINASLFPNLSFDIRRDIAPVAALTREALVLVVHPSVPAANLAEFEALLRANPGQVTITSAGVGTPTHLTAELFRSRTGVEFTHVPFGGAAPAHAALLGGQVQAMFHNPVMAVPAVQAGRLRALATTGAVRAVALPEVPTLAESGYPGFDSGTWYAVLGPAGLPAPVVARIDADLRRVIALPAVRDRLAAQSMEPRDIEPETLAAVMREELVRWTEVIRRLGIRQD
jgi:tripartite-type tricarboxylate transporter receptor subunit TctC